MANSKPGRGPWTRTLTNLDPEKPGPRKTWNLKNLDPEKCRKHLDIEISRCINILEIVEILLTLAIC